MMRAHHDSRFVGPVPGKNQSVTEWIIQKKTDTLPYLDHSRLSHTRFSNKNGVVLRPSAENANDPTDFVVATDNRVDLSVRSKSRQIDSVFRQGIKALLGIFGVNPTVSTNLVDSRFESGFGETDLLYDGLDAGVLDKGEEEMVLSNERIVHGLLNRLRLTEDFDSGRAEVDLIWRRRLRRQPNDGPVECPLDRNLKENVRVGAPPLR